MADEFEERKNGFDNPGTDTAQESTEKSTRKARSWFGIV